MIISSYDEYVNCLNGRGDVYVFRGQVSKDFLLIPSGLREEHIKNADVQMFQFVDELKNLFGFDELTCIEIAQHFSLPTRMLDFSYSYDVALFFACHDLKKKWGNTDAKVFIFNKSKYERILKEKNKLSSQAIHNNKFLYEWLQHYLDKKSTLSEYKGVDLPIFVDATQQFDRLHMQHGLFLLWGNSEKNFEEIMKEEGIDINEILDTIIIKAEDKPKILKELEAKHICEDTIYMNIEKVKDLVNEIKAKGKELENAERK